VEATVVVVAVNVVEVLPAAIATEAGTVTELELEQSATVAPPAGAAAERLAVQVAGNPPVTEAGVQLREESVTTAGVTVTEAVCEVLL
jgi:hypothetical protein